MELIDIIVIVLLIIGLITGIKDGLIKRVLGLVGFIAGLLIAKAIYMSVAERLTPFLGISEKATQILAFVLIMIVVPLIFSLIAWLIGNLLKTVGLGWVNRLLGGVIGVITNALFVGLFFVGIESFDTDEKFLSKEKKEASVFFYPLHQTASLLIKDVRAQIEQWKETHTDNADDADDSEEFDKSGDSDDAVGSGDSGKTEKSGKSKKKSKKSDKKELQSFEEVV